MRLDTLLPQHALQPLAERIRPHPAQKSNPRAHGGRGASRIGSAATRGFTNEGYGGLTILKEIVAWSYGRDPEVAVQVAGHT
jgi:hypothetical protein